MIVVISILSIVFIAFIASIGYLIYLKAHNRSIDEDDCALSKRNGIKIRLQEMKKKERKQALKKKRELEKLDRQESKKHSS